MHESFNKHSNLDLEFWYGLWDLHTIQFVYFNYVISLLNTNSLDFQIFVMNPVFYFPSLCWILDLAPNFASYSYTIFNLKIFFLSWDV
jgi:hypothetical protein